METITQIPTIHPALTPAVSICGCEYLVDLGPGTIPRYHRVNKEKRCACGRAACEAVDIVREHLLNGGTRAPDPLPPCPVCGARVIREPAWDGKYTHEKGWRCSQGGIGHFIQQKLERIRKNWEAHPYLIPPVQGYPGVRRDEILSAADLLPHYQRMAKEGYDPTA